MRLLSVFVLGLLCSISSSCSKLPDIYAAGQFDGISSSLREGRTATVFISHGLGGFSPKDPETFLAVMRQKLGLVECGPRTTRQILGETNCRSYGFLERRVYHRDCDGLTVYCYILDWRKATWDEKEMLRRSVDRYDLDSKELCLIRKLRDTLFVNNITDALMILGSFREQVRFPFEQSFRWIYDDMRCVGDNDIYLITHSFGGQLTLDSLTAMHASSDPVSQEARNYIIDHTRAFFMNANMAPFIYLHRMQPLAKSFPFHSHTHTEEVTPDVPGDDLNESLLMQQEPPEFDWVNTSLGDFVLKKRETDPYFQIIGFSDPNDLFSFYTRGALPGQEGCLPLPSDMMLNVWVRNAGYSILGAVVNPATAHTTYLQNPYVLWMMLYGLDHPILPPCGTPNYQVAVPQPSYVRLDSCADTIVYNPGERSCKDTNVTAEVISGSKPFRGLGGQLKAE